MEELKEELNKKLKNAIENEDYALAKKAIAEGADIHLNNDNLLLYTCELGKIEATKFLLDNGADVYADCSFPIYMAFINRHLDIVELLREHDNEIVKHAPIKEMANWSDLEVLDYLIKHGVTLFDNTEAIIGAILSSDTEVLEYFIEKGVTVENIEKVLDSEIDNIKVEDKSYGIELTKKWCKTKHLQNMLEKNLPDKEYKTNKKHKA